MIKKELLLDAKTGTATSDAVSVLRYLHKTFVFYGDSVVATAKVYGSYDGTTFVELGEIVNSGKFAVNESWSFVRATIDGYTSGTAYVALMAIDY